MSIESDKVRSDIVKNVFKSYDVRGRYGTEITESLTNQIGRAYVEVLGAKKVLVGHDMRVHSPTLEAALVEGIIAAGADVIRIGQCSTPMTYFGVSTLDVDAAIMVTASHNPGHDNGFKFSKRGGVPVGDGTGLEKVRELVLAGKAADVTKTPGKATQMDLLPEWCKFLKRFVTEIRPMTIVMDFGNGVMGPIIRALLREIDPTGKIKAVWLFEQPDGSFPWHPADPLKLLNMQHLQGAVLATKSEFGVAFDGDGDRLAFVDENAKFIGCDLMTAVFAKELLSRPGNTAKNVMFDLRCSAVVASEVQKAGGVPELCRVGHSHIKAAMRGQREGRVKDPKVTGDVVFAGEISGHFFFRDCFFFDSSERAFLLALQIMTHETRSLGQIIDPLRRFWQSGEINYKLQSVGQKDEILRQIESKFAQYEMFKLDGVSVKSPNWQMNVRFSNTEPVVRVVAESFVSQADLDQLLASIEEIINGLGGARYLR
jgi:phosphomannomutase